jgi:hypothetical protein
MSDWVRGFAAQNMSREEIMGLLGVSRRFVNNALNRATKRTRTMPAVPSCTACGAAAYEQEPSRVGMSRHCGSCGAHYRYWADRRKPKHVRATPQKPKPDPAREREELRQIIDRARRIEPTRTPTPPTTKPQMAGRKRTGRPKLHADEPPANDNAQAISGMHVRQWHRFEAHPDYRRELRAAAQRGDAYAKWRCWELFDAPDELEQVDPAQGAA